MAYGQGEPITVTWDELAAAAREMDAKERGLDSVQQGDWANRLKRVELLVAQPDGFAKDMPLGIDGLLHLVGMVGAGKSTLRDILTYWYVTKDPDSQKGPYRVTIVVGDVAETLAIVDTFTRLGVTAAPVLGQSTRERHIARPPRSLRLLVGQTEVSEAKRSTSASRALQNSNLPGRAPVSRWSSGRGRGARRRARR